MTNGFYEDSQLATKEDGFPDPGAALIGHSLVSQ